MQLPDAELKVGQPITPELLDWIDAVRIIFNLGKYSLKIVSSIPSSTGNDGDMLIYTNGVDTRRLYLYLDSTWCYVTITKP